jgi:hypothetical protein
VDDVPQSSPLVQNLGASVSAGNTLVVTFWLGRDKTNPGAQGVAYFDVAGTRYPMTFDTTLLPADSWQSYTLTQTITHAGNLSLGFYSTSPRQSWGDPHSWLDKISDVTVTNVPVPGSYAGWAAANGAGSQTMEQDHDHDGVPNGIEYFLGGNANTTGFTALPGVVKASNGTLSVTWTKAAAGYTGVYGTDYVVQSSTTLTGTWMDEPATGGGVTVTGNEVKHTFPSGSFQKFARLKVMGPP